MQVCLEYSVNREDLKEGAYGNQSLKVRVRSKLTTANNGHHSPSILAPQSFALPWKIEVRCCLLPGGGPIFGFDVDHGVLRVVGSIQWG